LAKWSIVFFINLRRKNCLPLLSKNLACPENYLINSNGIRQRGAKPRLSWAFAICGKIGVARPGHRSFHWCGEEAPKKGSRQNPCTKNNPETAPLAGGRLDEFPVVVERALVAGALELALIL
jgi:hypothetical protein